jgi:hypothetical protein
MIPCPIHKFLGIECPGCGMQRAIIELLKGNFIESIWAYPALFPIFIMFIYLILHLKLQFKNGATILKYFFIINSIIVSLNYLFKLTNIY